MAYLIISPETDADQQVLNTTETAAIAKALAQVGIRYERWPAEEPLPPNPTDEQVLHAYASACHRLQTEAHYLSRDVVRMWPTHPDKAALRAKFLAEHTHADDEVRFFVEGEALFYLHIAQHVYRVACDQGTLIGVPAGVPHWFDMGEHPHFTAIRLFTAAEGWVAQLTGATLAQRFPAYQPQVPATC